MKINNSIVSSLDRIEWEKSKQRVLLYLIFSDALSINLWLERTILTRLCASIISAALPLLHPYIVSEYKEIWQTFVIIYAIQKTIFEIVDIFGTV